MTVAAVDRPRLTEWDEFTGRLEAVDTVAVRPRVSGYVEPLHFNEGALVAAGSCCSRSTRVRSRQKSIGCAPS